MKLESLISKAKVKRCGSANYPVLSMTMHDGIVEQVNRFKKTIASKDTSSYKIVEPGQLVVGFPIDEGVIYVQGHDFVGIMSPAYNVWDIDRSKIHPAYLELALHSTRSMAYYADKMRGTTARRRSITDGNLLALEIPLPTLQAQNEIVSNLHQVNEIAAASKRRMEVLDDLVKSRFTEMFEMMPVSRQSLESCCTFIDYRGKTPPKTSSGIPLITAKNVRKGHFSKEPQEFISEDDYEAWMTRGFPDNGDVLFTTEAPLGNVCRIPEEPTKFALAQRIVAIQPYEELLNKCYVSHALQSSEFQRQVQRNSSGTTAKGIRVKLLKQLLIPVPPLSLQQEFADFVAQVDKLRFVCTCLIRNYGTHHDKIP